MSFIELMVTMHLVQEINATYVPITILGNTIEFSSSMNQTCWRVCSDLNLIYLVLVFEQQLLMQASYSKQISC